MVTNFKRKNNLIKFNVLADLCTCSHQRISKVNELSGFFMTGILALNWLIANRQKQPPAVFF